MEAIFSSTAVEANNFICTYLFEIVWIHVSGYSPCFLLRNAILIPAILVNRIA